MSLTMFQMQCTAEQKMAWRAAAGRVTLSRWARDVLNKAARFEGLERLTEPREAETVHRAIRTLALEESKPLPAWAQMPTERG